MPLASLRGAAAAADDVEGVEADDRPALLGAAAAASGAALVLVLVLVLGLPLPLAAPLPALDGAVRGGGVGSLEAEGLAPA
jgi:hypothetical protein